MAIMAMDTVKKRKIAAFVVATCFHQSTIAGDWLFDPSLVIDETYSDNIEQTTKNQLSSLVSQTGVAIQTSYQAQLLQFSFSSLSNYAFYSHDHDLDKDYHTLNSDFTLKLGQQGFSLIGSAAINNRARNGATNSLADIVSADTVRVETYSGGIAYNQSNSDFIINSNIRYNLTTSADNIGNQEGYSGSLFSKNGNGARLLFWDVQGSYQERNNNSQTSRTYQGEIKLGLITNFKLNPFLRYYDEDNAGNINRSGQSTESNAYGAGIRWLVTPRFHLDVSYNKPIGNTVNIDGEEQKEYLDASLNWQLSSRTQLEATFSQRFYGDSYSFNLAHQNKRLTNNINYQEQIQSFTRNNFNPVTLGNFWCPDGDSTILSNCYLPNNASINLDHFQLIAITDFELIEDNVLSLNKTLSWSSALKLARSSFTLNISVNNREDLATGVENKNSALTFTASRKVSGRSNIKLTGSYTDNHYQIASEFERQDRYRQVGISYDKSLNSYLKLTFDLSHVNRSSTQQQFNYNEGRAAFKITKDF